MGARSGALVPYKGNIDDVCVYNRALTVQEVGDLYRPGIMLRGGGVLRNGKISQ